MAMETPGGREGVPDVTRLPFPTHRRLVTAAMRAGRRKFPVHGLLEVDVTEAAAKLESSGQGLSFTAFIVAATARAVAAHPLVHAYRDWRGRLVMHGHVDVATMIEVEDAGGTFPLAHVLRNADSRSVRDLSDEIRGVSANIRTSESGRLLRGRTSELARMPGLLSLLYGVSARTTRVRRRSGTVTVSSVGMFGRGGGHAIGQATIMTLWVLVGGRSQRPRIVDDEVVPRLILDLTISLDHAIVDGGPAARFAAHLVDLLEHPYWIDDQPDPGGHGKDL